MYLSISDWCVFLFLNNAKIDLRTAIDFENFPGNFLPRCFPRDADCTYDKSCAHKERITQSRSNLFDLLSGLSARSGRKDLKRNARFRFVRLDVQLNGSYYKSREKARSPGWRAPILPMRGYQPSLTYKKCVKRKAQAGACGDFDAWRRSVPHSFSTWISSSPNFN